MCSKNKCYSNGVQMQLGNRGTGKGHAERAKGFERLSPISVPEKKGYRSAAGHFCIFVIHLASHTAPGRTRTMKECSAVIEISHTKNIFLQNVRMRFTLLNPFV